MLRYPIGIQDFATLREGNYVYVDKTQHIERLVNSGKNYFLSRPRRFGKSLFINTLKYFFEGRKELFKGLYIEDKTNWETHPVIHLDFTTTDYTKDFYSSLCRLLEYNAEKYGIQLTSTIPLKEQFQELILSFDKKPVILIDEYDKPILHFLGVDNEKAHENREIMREFYSILKPLGGNLHFLFITGITRFSKTSLFSDMNHLLDITINQKFGAICGYTQTELEHYFSEAIEKMAEENDKILPIFWEDIKTWYNGYRWNMNADSVYNPFSILNFLYEDTSIFSNYWFNSGLPTFLIQILNKNEDYDFNEIEVPQTLLDNFNIDDLQSETLLFQAGYLTIKEQYDTIFTLIYPNKEVKQSLLDSILVDKTHNSRTLPMIVQLRNYFENCEEEKIRDVFETLFAKIPYQIFKEKSEYYYHSILVVAMQLLGCYIQTEVSINKGRIDVIVHTKKYIYIMELKVNQSAEIAINQIKERAYTSPYLQEEKTIFAIGINFKDKKIESMIMEKV